MMLQCTSRGPRTTGVLRWDLVVGGPRRRRTTTNDDDDRNHMRFVLEVAARGPCCPAAPGMLRHAAPAPGTPSMTAERERMALARAQEEQLSRLQKMGAWVSDELLERQFRYDSAWRRSLPQPCIHPPGLELARRKTAKWQPRSCQAWSRSPRRCTDSVPGIAPGWTKMLSKSTGKIYYFHAEMGASIYEEPLDPGDPLPSGWVMLLSKRTGKIYYFHTATKTAVLERPAVKK